MSSVVHGKLNINHGGYNLASGRLVPNRRSVKTTMNYRRWIAAAHGDTNSMYDLAMCLVRELEYLYDIPSVELVEEVRGESEDD